ncbi:MAG: tyrosine-type recombinase/integrase [Pseudomonadota bacterium]
MPRKKLTKPNYRLSFVKATGKWAVSWTDAATGKTKRKTTGEADYAAAALVMPQIVRDIESPRNSAYTLGNLLDAYERDHVTGKSKTSTEYALRPLRQFFAAYAPDQLCDAVWNDYRKWRTAQKINNATPVKNKAVSDATAVRELRTMNAALNYGKRNRWAGMGNVQVWITDTPDNVREDYLERDEVLALLKACTELHQRLYIRISLATAARMSAVLQLTFDKVTWPKDFEAVGYSERPYIYDEKTGASTGGPDFGLEMATPLRFDLGRGRGNKRRGSGSIHYSNMALLDDLEDAYALTGRNDAAHVIQYKGKPVKTMDLADVYRRAGLSHKRAQNHILKHTAITYLVQAGESFEDISKLTGTSVQIIERVYGHHSPKLLARVGSVLNF